MTRPQSNDATLTGSSEESRDPIVYPLLECQLGWRDPEASPGESKRPEPQDILPIRAVHPNLADLGRLGLRQVRASILWLLSWRVTSGAPAASPSKDSA